MSVLVEGLREEFASDGAVLVVGAGVTIAATGNAPVASWYGLLEDGIRRCEDVAGVPHGWGPSAC